MNDEEKVAAAGAAKDAGNKAFKAGRWARAAKKYKAATEAISFDDKFTDELKRQVRAMCASDALPCCIHACCWACCVWDMPCAGTC